MKSTNLNTAKSIDLAINKSRLKDLVSESVDSMLSADVLSALKTKLEGEVLASRRLGSQLLSAIGAEKMSVEECMLFEAPKSMNKAEVSALSEEQRTARKEHWSKYEVLNKASLLMLKVDALNSLVDGKFKKKMRTIFKTLINGHLSVRKDRVIVNSVINSIAKAMGKEGVVGFQAAMNVLDSLSNTSLLSLENTENLESGAHEWTYQLNIDMAEMFALRDQVSDRNILFSDIESVEGSVLQGRRKFNYDYEMNQYGSIGIDWINQTQLEFTGNKSDIELLTKRKLFSKDTYKGALLTEEWQQRILQNHIRLFNLNEAMGNSFRISHATDGVMRLYEKSDFFGVQQNSLMRSKIGLKNKIKLDENGLYYTKLSIACKMGYDKVLEEEAMEAWELNHEKWLADGECAAEFAALYSSEPTGLLVELDAQTQGFGLYAILSADKHSMVLSGFLGNNVRTDAYSMLSNKINKALDTDVFTRSACKSPFMLKLYNAKYNTLMYGSKADIDNGIYEGASDKQIPLMATSDSDTKSTWLAFDIAMNQIAPRAISIMEVIDYAAKESPLKVVKWTMPDGVVASVAMQETVENHVNWISSDGKNHTMLHHSTILLAGSKATAWSPRIIQSFDAYLVRESARRLSLLGIELVTIHDAYMVHPNHVSVLMDTYRKVASELLEGNWLSRVMTEITGKGFNFQATSSGTVEDILRSKYAIWF